MDWSLKSKLIGFEELKGSHSGANIAAKIVEVLDQYEIRDKVCKFISLLTIKVKPNCYSSDGLHPIMLLLMTRPYMLSNVACHRV